MVTLNSNAKYCRAVLEDDVLLLGLYVDGEPLTCFMFIKFAVG